MSELEKRLIALSAHGIYIVHADGHRWIYSHPTDYFDYDLELKKHGISVNNKIYGGVVEALNVIDESFGMIGKISLLEWFDSAIDEEWDVALAGSSHNRIDVVPNGRGGLN